MKTSGLTAIAQQMIAIERKVSDSGFTRADEKQLHDLMAQVEEKTYRDIDIVFQDKAEKGSAEHRYRFPKAKDGCIVIKELVIGTKKSETRKANLSAVWRRYPDAGREILSAIRGETEKVAYAEAEQIRKRESIAEIIRNVESQANKNND